MVIDMVIKVSNMLLFLDKVPWCHYGGSLKFEFSKNHYDLMNE